MEPNFIRPTNGLATDDLFELCKQPKYLFSTVFYLFFINGSTGCISHLWYISCEFWFFVTTVILMTFWYKKGFRKFAHITMAVLSLTSIALTIIIIVQTKTYFPNIWFGYEVPDGWVTFDENQKWYTNFYMLPWCRSAAYFIGVWFGVFLSKVDRKLVLSKVQASICWVFIIVVTFSIVLLEWLQNLTLFHGKFRLILET